MKFFVVAATLVALTAGAPTYVNEAPVAAVGYAAAAPAAAVGYAAAPAAAIGYAAAPAAAVVASGPPRAHVTESIHAGPAIAKTFVEHGVVGHRTVQVGSQAVQVGHEAYIAGQEVHQPAPYSYVAGAPKATQHTVALPPPALPVAAPTAYAIPPAPRNLGPAPADTVTQEVIAAPARVHTRITPQATRVEPELHVNQVPYDVPVHVPVPVHRDVVVTKTVEKPVPYDVPRAVPVPAPYKVHPVHEVVETPVIHEHVTSVTQPKIDVATHTYTHHAVAHAPVAVAEHAAVGYAAAAPVAVAEHAVGYAAAAPVAAAGYAAAPVAAAGYAAHAPVAAAGYAAHAPVAAAGYAAHAPVAAVAAEPAAVAIA